MLSNHELLKQLDDCDNAKEFLQVSNQIINAKLKALLPKVFLQDRQILENAVEPLLKEDGPLVDTGVIIKLLLAMGKLSLETYSDIELYRQVLEFVSEREETVSYGDDVLFDFISNQAVLSTQQDSFYIESINQLKFSSFETFSQMRYESLIQTVLRLSCEMLLEKIEKEMTT